MGDPCERRLCTDDAEVILIFVMRKRGYEEHPVRAAYGLKLCRMHGAEVTVEKFITDHIWSQFMMAFRQEGKALPDRELTTIECIPIDSDEAKSFFRVAMRLPKPMVH